VSYAAMAGTPTFDLLIVGGGINGAGIARDAAGRGLKVLLVEKDDLASHTSSASTKLIHGGLRYLEQLEFRLVRESLAERERLLGIAPHIVHPLEFVVPQVGSARPAWLVRLGLFLYDHLGGRKRLPPTRTLDLATDPQGDGLKNRAGKAFCYADCFVDDSRLAVLNAVDAAERGVRIATRTELVHAERGKDLWQATLLGPQGQKRVAARVLVNAAGPWVTDLLRRIHVESRRHVRLVKGSHIVLPRLYAGNHAFLIQNSDRRVAFAIPFERDFTLVGTTDSFWDAEPGSPRIDDAEIDYLLDVVDRTFARPVGRDNIVWTYSGIRPLFDDGSRNAARVTRDYSLELDLQGAPVLSIFGGKLTTYRRLAEQVLHRLHPIFPDAGEPWTASLPLPGGDLPEGGSASLLAALRTEFPAVPPALLDRLARTYGTRARQILSAGELGPIIAGDLTEREARYLVEHEWARTAEDILFRRTKLGLHLPPAAASRLEELLNQMNRGSTHAA
jgi:glycerol-3-phosphate dehydrogenase